LLQSIINSALHRGILSLPLPRGGGAEFPIVQYADGTLLFLEACPRQLILLKSLLNTFAESTGLKVNYQKSCIYPINVDQDKMDILAQTFGRQIGTYPFTYLGLPMGPNKPKVEDFFPLVQRMERRLVSTSNFLTQAGKLEMVNSVLSALPTFFMSTLKLPPTIIKLIDKYRKHCFWRGSDLNDRKPPLAAWSLATRPKKEGGLGIINLHTQNDALLLKNLHKFFNMHDYPWVKLLWDNYYSDGNLPDQRPRGSFWWRAILKLLDKFKGIAMVQIQNGATVSLWHDLWNGQLRMMHSSELYSFIVRRDISVQQARSMEDLHNLFQLPLTTEAFQQYEVLLRDLDNLDSGQETDKWTYIWGSCQFSVNKAYSFLAGHMPTHPIVQLLWKSKCQPKHKVFLAAITG
jgi:hypothetical protein